MVRKRTRNTFRCGHEGCSEFGGFSRSNRKDDIRQQKNYGGGKWRCLRHNSPEEVLSPYNQERQTILQPVEVVSDRTENSLGLFWGRPDGSHGSGFAHGPGWKAWAGDFPEGTKIIVTARVILPRRLERDSKNREQERQDAADGL